MSSTSSSDKTKRESLPTFDGTNYRVWADQIKNFARFQGLWSLIEGYGSTPGNILPGLAEPNPVGVTAQAAQAATATTPAIPAVVGIPAATPAEIAAWWDKNDKLLGLISMHVAQNLQHHVVDKYKASDAWEALRNVYEKPGAVGAFVEFQALFNSHLSDSSALAPQIDSMIEAASRVTAAGIEVKEQLLALLLINALPKSYQTIAGTILSTVADVKAMTYHDIRPKIIEEEQRRVANKTQLTKVSKVPQFNKHCDKCGKNNHSTEQHRDDWKPRSSKGASSGNSGTSGNGESSASGSGKKSRDKGKGKAKDNAAPKEKAAHLDILEVPSVPSASEESIAVSAYAMRDKVEWMIDSGCTSHVTNNRSDFVSYHEFTQPGKAQTAGKEILQIFGHGSILMGVHGGSRPLLLKDVLYIPDASARLYAPRQPLELGHKITMDDKVLTLHEKSYDGPSLFVADYRKEDKLYWLDATIMKKSPSKPIISAVKAQSSDYELWHRRFGHAGKKQIESLPGNVEGVPKSIQSPASIPPCDGCEFGKSKRDAFPPSDKRAEHVLDLIHMDLVEYPVNSLDNYKYTLTTLDDHSSFGVMWYLKQKSQALTCFRQFVAWAETQTDRKVKAIRSDRGGEFLGHDFDAYLAEKGIERQLSVARSPQQNGRAERWQQTIQTKAEAMRHHAGLSPGFWKLSVETAVHIYNRQPLRRHSWKPPITVWNGTKPDVSYFRVFGCKAYVHTHKEARINKLQAKAKVMIFVGYELGTKGYRFWDPTTRSIVVARDVVFDENSFPRRETGPREPEPVEAAPPAQPEPNPDLDPDDLFPGDNDAPPDHPAPPPPPDEPRADDDDDDDLYADPLPPKAPAPAADEPRFVPGPAGPPRQRNFTDEQLLPPHMQRWRHQQRSDARRQAREHMEQHAPPPPQPVPTAPRPRRQNAGNRRVPDNTYGDVPATEAWRRQEEQIRRDQREERRASAPEPVPEVPDEPMQDPEIPDSEMGHDSDAEMDYEYPDAPMDSARWIYHYIRHASTSQPLTYREAMSRPDAKQWEIAMQEEIKSQMENGTWILVKRPNNRRVVKCKWVYDIKSDGRYKARLVAKGFTQIEGIDFQETFSPVARYEAIRLLLAHAALEDWELEAMDIKTAFLYGELDEEIYMEQPEGFVEKGQENQVCRLKKAIYGLKQASRTWNQKLHRTLLAQGFKRTRSDAGVYVYSHDQAEIILIVYVDDLLHMGPSLTEIKRFKQLLADEYQMRDLGAATTFLGMRITRDRSKRILSIDQQPYTEGILSRFNMHNSKPQWTPVPEKIQLQKGPEGYTASPSFRKLYQQMIGSLIYLMIGTRPDIAWAVSRLAQYMQDPTEHHMSMTLHVFRYLRATTDYKIWYNGASDSGLIGYSDATWADNLDNRRSTTGYVFLMADGAVTWSSRMQKRPAKGSTDAEYQALSEACSEAAWLLNLQGEIGYTQTGPAPLLSDNQGAIFNAINPAHDRRLKHMDLSYHFIRDFVEQGRIDILYVSTNEMIADTLTKSLGRTKFEYFRKLLGVSNRSI